MKYKVLTDTWKRNLSKGDMIESEYPSRVLARAVQSGYIQRCDPPTMSSKKEEIIDWLEEHGVGCDKSKTKSELLDLL